MQLGGRMSIKNLGMNRMWFVFKRLMYLGWWYVEGEGNAEYVFAV